MVGGKGGEGEPINIPISHPHYGTFPPPSAPPLCGPQQPHPQSQQPIYHHAIPIGYQSVPYPWPSVVQEGFPVMERRLPFCGLGVGWALFIFGFFLAAVPWYVGIFILLFVSQDYREKPGLVACTVAETHAEWDWLAMTFESDWLLKRRLLQQYRLFLNHFRSGEAEGYMDGISNAMMHRIKAHAAIALSNYKKQIRFSSHIIQVLYLLTR